MVRKEWFEVSRYLSRAFQRRNVMNKQGQVVMKKPIDIRARRLSETIYYNGSHGLVAVTDVVRVSHDEVEATFTENSTGYMGSPIEKGERWSFSDGCYCRAVINPRDRWDQIELLEKDYGTTPIDGRASIDGESAEEGSRP